MMNMINKPLIALCLLMPVAAMAQKMRKVQQGNLRAPVNIKVDGELTEWGNQFQAYNMANLMYYTISNDDNNLYLTVQMADMVGSKKIFRGGLTFTIIPDLKPADKLAITFPFIAKKSFKEEEQLGSNQFAYTNYWKIP
jgi:hypothetical protein